MHVMQIEYHTTPFRAARFLELYRPAVSRAMAYGAKGYLFFRNEEDPDHFIHLSYWDDRSAFERYWHSRDMQETRQQIAGLHGQPVLPHWGITIEGG